MTSKKIIRIEIRDKANDATVIAFSEAAISPKFKSEPMTSQTRCHIEDDESLITVTGKTIRWHIDKRTACLKQISDNGRNVLLRSIKPVTSRQSALSESFKGKVKTYEKVYEEDLLKLSMECRVKGFEGTFKITYIFSSEGECNVTYHGICNDELECFSSSFVLNSNMDMVSFYGSGPEVTYSDTSNCAMTGIYNMSVDDYNKSSNLPLASVRSAIRWLSVVDQQGQGVMIESNMDSGIGVGLYNEPH